MHSSYAINISQLLYCCQISRWGQFHSWPLLTEVRGLASRWLFIGHKSIFKHKRMFLQTVILPVQKHSTVRGLVKIFLDYPKVISYFMRKRWHLDPKRLSPPQVVDSFTDELHILTFMLFRHVGGGGRFFFCSLFPLPIFLPPGEENVFIYFVKHNYY